MKPVRARFRKNFWTSRSFLLIWRRFSKARKQQGDSRISRMWRPWNEFVAIRGCVDVPLSGWTAQNGGIPHFVRNDAGLGHMRSPKPLAPRPLCSFAAIVLRSEVADGVV